MARIVQLIPEGDSIVEVLWVLSARKYVKLLVHGFDLFVENCVFKLFLYLDGSLLLHLFVDVVGHDCLTQVVGIPVVISVEVFFIVIC